MVSLTVLCLTGCSPPPPPVFVPVPTAPPAGMAGRTIKDCDVCPTMIVVPTGNFLMGAPPGEQGRDESEGPDHVVEIPIGVRGRGIRGDLHRVGGRASMPGGVAASYRRAADRAWVAIPWST